ncbi:protein kinase domain-containing protein [Plesiocystis pacifica]|uniref:protein kinase domain-containing protein n=1 Tax=Plesiocystis pacifica TaxID=191768 RepID=UPI000A308EE6
MIERLGSGAFGVVYLAEDNQLGREVALKVMPRGDPEVADREGKMLAALSHPNVVTIFDHGQADDCRWLVLEILRGPTLAQWCEGKSKREILARYLEAGAGLDAAHRRGLVHQDFKPTNVRLDEDGHAVVIDFGLARNAESLDGLTPGSGSPEAVGGTLLYMARERLLGKLGSPASDQFAFCVALWEALSGERPFGEQSDVDARVLELSRAPRGGQGIGRRVRAVLERGMAPLPGERWPTMTVLLEALEEAVRPAPRWPWVAGGVCVGLLGLAMGSRLVTQPGLVLPSVVLPEPEPDPEPVAAITEIRDALEARDHNRARQALDNARPVLRRAGRLREFVDEAQMVAERFEDDGLTHEALDVWMMVFRAAEDLDDETLEDTADEKIKELAGKL